MGDWSVSSSGVDDSPKESFIAPDAHVLVVDDNIDNLQTIKALLRRTLVNVDLATSGAKCLEAVREMDYHIILMDHMMPDMDGIETFRRLREESPNFAIPVIAQTANAIAGTESKFLNEGFFAYITKPVQAQKLEEVLMSGLSLTSATITKRTISDQNWSPPQLKETLHQVLSDGGISLDEGLFNTSGDLLLLTRMADIFVKNYQSSLSRIQNLYKTTPNNFDKLRHLVHSLKSGAGYVGATSLSYHSQLVEKACADCDDQTIKLTMPILFMEWERAKKALSEFTVQVNYSIKPAASLSKERRFQAERLEVYLQRRMRLKAIQEIDLLIAEKGPDCSASLLDAKRAIEELDFEKAKQLTTTDN
jgi:CheY-like chemotaxis protein